VHQALAALAVFILAVGRMRLSDGVACSALGLIDVLLDLR
jgi:hypothetical protein